MRQRLIHWLFQRGKSCRHCCLCCEYYDLCSREVRKTIHKRQKKGKRVFYSEYMERHRPKTPSCICQNEFYRQQGIVSPSLYQLVSYGYMGEKAAEELAEYSGKMERYLCYKRRLSKERWKALYREYRKERREHEEL